MVDNNEKIVDVLVVGYGLAGAVAAITAHDAGSEVLILEKAKHPGGCSILAGGSIFMVRNVENAIKYFSALSGGRVSAEMIESFAYALAENLDYIKQLAKVDGATVKLKEKDGLYPFPGNKDAFGSVWITHVPGFKGFPNVKSTLKNGQMMFKVVMDNLDARNIPVLMNTPARELIVDRDGAVIGVKAQGEGEDITFRSRKGVVLACGGFEHSENLLLKYLQGKPFYSMAPLSLTGDGILMAQKVGASLTHMWHLHGSYGFKFPECPVAFRISFGGPRQPDRKMPWIVVDKQFKRYMNEYPPAPQDIAYRPMELFDADLLDYPRIPSYLVFDEEGRKKGRIAKAIGFADEIPYEWSKDNIPEVERGWILKADSLNELAAKLKEISEDKSDSDVTVLERTVLDWNKCVESGKDPLFRLPGNMMTINKPPFYGVLVWPIIINTQGGPVHNTRQQVLDPFDNVIPRLYTAGELGSFFSHLYELGGNLGECFTSGRAAGENAAAESPIE